MGVQVNKSSINNKNISQSSDVDLLLQKLRGELDVLSNKLHRNGLLTSKAYQVISNKKKHRVS